MLILGLDPGSSLTGYGLVESRPGRLNAVAFGTLSAPRGLAFLERLPHIARALELLAERYRPDAVAAEDVFVSRNVRVALKLGHARGAALLPLLRAGIPIHEYPARMVKKAVTGFGAADKEQVRRMVRVLLALQGASLALDASDALAVAICHVHAQPVLPRRVIAQA